MATSCPACSCVLKATASIKLKERPLHRQIAVGGEGVECGGSTPLWAARLDAPQSQRRGTKMARANNPACEMVAVRPPSSRGRQGRRRAAALRNCFRPYCGVSPAQLSNLESHDYVIHADCSARSVAGNRLDMVADRVR